jgi:hypothetical protein
MGMYDSIMMEAKCPFCGEVCEREMQTKDLDSLLNVYRRWDKIDRNRMWYNRNYVTTITECASNACWDKAKNGGYGMGRFFYAKIFLVEGIITGEYEITDEQQYGN